jgi:hypothetical protein
VRTGIKIEGVQSFVELIENFVASFHAENKAGIVGKYDLAGTAGWRKQYVKPVTDYSIEIVKSETCKTALVGVFRFKLEVFQTKVCQTRERAEGLTDFMSTSEFHRHTYAFERSRWVLKEREHARAEAPDHYVACTSVNMCSEKWY